MKKHFIVYENWAEMFLYFSDDVAGKLIKTLCKYSLTGEAEPEDKVIGAIFAMMKVSMDENNEKYRKKVERLNRNRINSGKQNFADEDQEEITYEYAD